MTDIISFISLPKKLLADRWQYLLRVGLVLGVLIGSVILADKVSPNQIYFIIALPVAAVGSIVLLKWPQLGLIALTFVGMIIRYVGPGAVNVSVGLVALLLALWIVEMVVGKRKISFVSSRTMLPLVALIVVALVAFIIGQFSWFNFVQNAPLDAQLGGLGIFILSAGAFILVANQIRDIRWLEIMTWVFVAVGTVFIAGRLVPSLLDPVIRFIFTSGAIGGVFWAWLPALTLSQALMNRKLHIGWRAILLGIVLATLYVAYVRNYEWKSGWLPSFVAVGVIIWLYSWRLGLAISAIAVVALTTLLPQFLESDAYSVATRYDAWVIMFEIVKVNPILGLGFGNYYWYTPLFRIRGWEVTFNSHNNYVDIVAQTGLLGLICFFWFIWEVGQLAWSLRNKAPEGFAQAYVYGALGGLVATIVAAGLGDWVLPFVYNIGLGGFRTGVLAWMFLGGLVVVEQLCGQNHETLPSPKATTNKVPA